MDRSPGGFQAFSLAARWSGELLRQKRKHPPERVFDHMSPLYVYTDTYTYIYIYIFIHLLI